MNAMKRFTCLLFLSFLLSIVSVSAQRKEIYIKNEWKFAKGDTKEASAVNFNDNKWQSVSVPHDWAIYGPFNRNNDLQNVIITQNLEKKASAKTGRTGGLPYVGVGWYRHAIDVSDINLDRQSVTLLFDGAMSEAEIYVNGEKVMFWPYGYNSFFVDITKSLRKGEKNILAVRLENKPQSSRWYSGAGLFRNVHLITTEKVHVPVWGTYVTTPHVSASLASVCLKTRIENLPQGDVKVITEILAPSGEVVAVKENVSAMINQTDFTQHFTVLNPELWSPESPSLYQAVSKIFIKDSLVDKYTTRFGIRSIEFIPDNGFYLNGHSCQIKGVCMHHDLGALGAAVNKEALRHRLSMLKDMGCNAVRTSHNMPAPELVELCDEMGIMLMIEPFDEWDKAKCENGYHRYFNDWAEKDMINMIRHYRNDPSVIMWSIGNEVPTQSSKAGFKVAEYLQNICHREDPTRPVTCGMDQVSSVLNNGFAALLDVPGFNYRVGRYIEGYNKLPQNMILGSETVSTVSSRGVYKFPVEKKADAQYSDHQSSSYDMESCSWSNLPDYDFAMQEDHPWAVGQFVWTGFDYLGEPSPYDTDAWPSHSSLFGIIDLAELPKDRFYLYRSQWNKESHTLHVLPHWTWPGREGKITPVFVYTDYPSAELFINGKSQGIRYKNDSTVFNRYRLMWNETIYKPGQIKVVAYNKDKQPVDSTIVSTAGKPDHLLLTTDKQTIKADGEDLIYVTVSVVDKNGILCPSDDRLINFKVEGKGTFCAVANGDPTCIESFQGLKMHAFSGMLTAIVRSKTESGDIAIKASAKGVKEGIIRITSKLN